MNIRADDLLGGGIAILAAFLLAVAAVLQQRVAFEVPTDKALHLSFVRRLLQRPLWLVGLVVDIAALAAQGAALRFASLLIVQPLLVLAIVFAIPMGAKWSGRKLHRSDFVWGVLLCGSLVVFLMIGRPTAGVARAPFLWHWAIAILIVITLAAIFVFSASRLPKGPPRAALLGSVAGILFGATGALLKGVVANITDFTVVLTHWELYGFIVGVSAGQFFQNASYESGNLQEAFPATTALKPLIAALLGVAVLQETLRAEGWELFVVGGAAGVMLVATIMLARSAGRPTEQSAE